MSPVNWTDKERMFFVQTRPKIFKAILTSVLAFIIFFVVYFLVYIICGLAIDLLLGIPVIGWLIDLLFFFRGDSPKLVLSLLSPGVSYWVTIIIQEKISKDAPTMGLSCILLGVGVALLQVLSLVLNLIYGESIWTNIVLIITGCIFLFNGIGEIKKTN